MRDEDLVKRIANRLGLNFNNALFQEITAIHRSQSDLFPPHNLKKLLNKLGVRPLLPGEIYDWETGEQGIEKNRDNNRLHWYMFSYRVFSETQDATANTYEGFQRKGVTRDMVESQKARVFPQNDPSKIIPIAISYMGHYTKAEFAGGIK